jgi:hypothetical protein
MSTSMTLDGTSHLDRPTLDELVPSRYALKVGGIDVLVVSDGVISLPAETTATNADPADRAAWLKEMFLPPETLDWALNAVVVRNGGRTILIDAGLGADPEVNLPRAGRLTQRLGACGEPRAAGGHSHVVPVHRPRGGRRRRLSLGTGLLGVLTACWARAEPGDQSHGMVKRMPTNSSVSVLAPMSRWCGESCATSSRTIGSTKNT